MLYVRAVGLCESSEFYNPNHPNPKSWQNKPANRIKAEGGGGLGVGELQRER
jgi:hypothetical protein